MSLQGELYNYFKYFRERNINNRLYNQFSLINKYFREEVLMVQKIEIERFLEILKEFNEDIEYFNEDLEHFNKFSNNKHKIDYNYIIEYTKEIITYYNNLIKKHYDLYI